MTDSMIERVARAICRANCTPDMSAEDIDCQEENAWDMWVPEARAAIEAMREPTEEMLYCGDAQISDWDRTHEDVRAAWHAMIDAALKEKP